MLQKKPSIRLPRVAKGFFTPAAFGVWRNFVPIEGNWKTLTQGTSANSNMHKIFAHGNRGHESCNVTLCIDILLH